MKIRYYLPSLILPALVLGACNTPTTNSAIAPSTTSPTPSTTTANLSTYTAADVANHNSRSSCWIVISNNVYDVTSFGPQHPGGDQIYQGCGQDITTYMKTSHKPVDNLLPQFLIGSLKP